MLQDPTKDAFGFDLSSSSEDDDDAEDDDEVIAAPATTTTTTTTTTAQPVHLLEAGSDVDDVFALPTALGDATTRRKWADTDLVTARWLMHKLPSYGVVYSAADIQKWLPDSVSTSVEKLAAHNTRYNNLVEQYPRLPFLDGDDAMGPNLPMIPARRPGADLEYGLRISSTVPFEIAALHVRDTKPTENTTFWVHTLCLLHVMAAADPAVQAPASSSSSTTTTTTVTAVGATGGNKLVLSPFYLYRILIHHAFEAKHDAKTKKTTLSTSSRAMLASANARIYGRANMDALLLNMTLISPTLDVGIQSDLGKVTFVLTIYQPDRLLLPLVQMVPQRLLDDSYQKQHIVTFPTPYDTHNAGYNTVYDGIVSSYNVLLGVLFAGHQPDDLVKIARLLCRIAYMRIIASFTQVPNMLGPKLSAHPSAAARELLPVEDTHIRLATSQRMCRFVDKFRPPDALLEAEPQAPMTRLLYYDTLNDTTPVKSLVPDDRVDAKLRMLSAALVNIRRRYVRLATTEPASVTLFTASAPTVAPPDAVTRIKVKWEFVPGDEAHVVVTESHDAPAVPVARQERAHVFNEWMFTDRAPTQAEYAQMDRELTLRSNWIHHHMAEYKTGARIPAFDDVTADEYIERHTKPIKAAMAMVANNVTDKTPVVIARDDVGRLMAAVGHTPTAQTGTGDVVGSKTPAAVAFFDLPTVRLYRDQTREQMKAEQVDQTAMMNPGGKMPSDEDCMLAYNRIRDKVSPDANKWEDGLDTRLIDNDPMPLTRAERSALGWTGAVRRNHFASATEFDWLFPKEFVSNQIGRTWPDQRYWFVVLNSDGSLKDTKDKKRKVLEPGGVEFRDAQIAARLYNAMLLAPLYVIWKPLAIKYMAAMRRLFWGYQHFVWVWRFIPRRLVNPTLGPNPKPDRSTEEIAADQAWHDAADRRILMRPMRVGTSSRMLMYGDASVASVKTTGRAYLRNTTKAARVQYVNTADIWQDKPLPPQPAKPAKPAKHKKRKESPVRPDTSTTTTTTTTHGKRKKVVDVAPANLLQGSGAPKLSTPTTFKSIMLADYTGPPPLDVPTAPVQQQQSRWTNTLVTGPGGALTVNGLLVTTLASEYAKTTLAAQQTPDATAFVADVLKTDPAPGGTYNADAIKQARTTLLHDIVSAVLYTYAADGGQRATELARKLIAADPLTLSSTDLVQLIKNSATQAFKNMVGAEMEKLID